MMQKRIVILMTVVCLLLTSCSTNGDQQLDIKDIDAPVSSDENNQIDGNSEVTPAGQETRIVREVELLFEELLKFKNDAEFKRVGFALNGPYYDWLQRVKKLKNDPNKSILLHKGFTVGDLELLGQEYKSNNGMENDYTKFMRKSIVDGLSR